MSAKPLDLSKRDIPNTFAPKCRAKFFSINSIIFALQLGLLKTEDIPKEVKAKFPKPHYDSDEDSYPYPIKSKPLPKEESNKDQL